MDGRGKAPPWSVDSQEFQAGNADMSPFLHALQRLIRLSLPLRKTILLAGSTGWWMGALYCQRSKLFAWHCWDHSDCSGSICVSYIQGKWQGACDSCAARGVCWIANHLTQTGALLGNLPGKNMLGWSLEFVERGCRLEASGLEVRSPLESGHRLLIISFLMEGAKSHTRSTLPLINVIPSLRPNVSYFTASSSLSTEDVPRHSPVAASGSHTPFLPLLLPAQAGDLQPSAGSMVLPGSCAIVSWPGTVAKVVSDTVGLHCKRDVTDDWAACPKTFYFSKFWIPVWKLSTVGVFSAEEGAISVGSTHWITPDPIWPVSCP